MKVNFVHTTDGRIFFWHTMAIFLTFHRLKYQTMKKGNIRFNAKSFIVTIFFSLSFQLLLAQSSTKTKTIRWHLLTFSEEVDGGIALYKGQPYTGSAEMYYPKPEGQNARVRPQIARKAGFKNGKLHGEYADFKPNGDFEIRETFKDGIKHGPFYYYYPSGGLEFMGTYDQEVLNGVIKGYYQTGELNYVNRYTKGERNGVCKTYYKNGNLLSISRFRLGYPRGEQKGYYQDSTLMYYKVFDDSGFLNGPFYEFHRTGCAAREEYYKKGKLDSIQRAWDALSCELIRSGYWKEGKKEGMHVELNIFGDTLKITNYKDGKKEGYFGQFQLKKVQEEKITKKFRVVESEGYYKNDLPDGFWEYGKQSCYQHREGAYKMGVKIGEWKYYDHNCKLLLTQKYDQEGLLLEEKMHE